MSIESSIMFMDLLKRDVEGRLKENIIASKKGDDYYFKKAGFIVSNRYKQQEKQYYEERLCKIKEE